MTREPRRIFGKEDNSDAPSRRLSQLEYMLLAVIAIAVMITVAMAIIDPSG